MRFHVTAHALKATFSDFFSALRFARSTPGWVEIHSTGKTGGIVHQCQNGKATAEFRHNDDNYPASDPSLLVAAQRALDFIGQSQDYKTGHTGAGQIVGDLSAAIKRAQGLN